MGCFLACFGTSKDGKRRKHKQKVLPQDKRNTSSEPVEPGFCSVPLEDNPQNVSPVQELELGDKPDGQRSFSARKKVTFNPHVKTYVLVSPDHVTDFPSENKRCVKREESKASSEDSSMTSSTASYPSNHRYQNCRDTDDEYEEIVCEGSELFDDDDLVEDLEDSSDGVEDEFLDSRTSFAATQLEDATVISDLINEEVKPVVSNSNARDRSVYVHSVLNPVENVTQWKTIKAKRISPSRHHKENLVFNHDHLVSSNSRPNLKDPSYSFKSKYDSANKPSEKIAVDASLSNWVVSSETTLIHKSTGFYSEGAQENGMSQGSTSVISQEDRPVLGALTMEELKQFSASSSPKKSPCPCRSPGEMPIIGTVGTFWNHTGHGNDSGSASSFKGIPNTTSKYREDKKVNWHSTPFETRLERALKKVST